VLPLFRRSRTVHTGRCTVHSPAITGSHNGSTLHESRVNCHHDCHPQTATRSELIAPAQSAFSLVSGRQGTGAARRGLSAHMRSIGRVGRPSGARRATPCNATHRTAMSATHWSARGASAHCSSRTESGDLVDHPVTHGGEPSVIRYLLAAWQQRGDLFRCACATRTDRGDRGNGGRRNEY
jgi:hypothetical protein